MIEDITDRKIAEKRIEASLQEKDILLKEIHHRVKNNLQIVSSLLKFQAKYTDDERVIAEFRESQNRIRSMALIHEKLYQSQDLARINFAEYIRSLAKHLFHSHNAYKRGVALHLEVDNVSLDIDAGIPCGLIINELVSNVLEHAFPTRTINQSPRIYIGLKAGDTPKLVLTVGDNGIGLPPGFDIYNSESLGLQLVTMLVEQIEGDIIFEVCEGTKFEITFNPNDVKG
jgi:two-component sensor histidine kinase